MTIMKVLEKLFVMAILVLVIAALGCIGASTRSGTSPSRTSVNPLYSASSSYSSSTFHTSAPQVETIYDKTITLNSSYYIGPFSIKSPSTVTITLSDLGSSQVSYVGIISASQLSTWRENPEAVNYVFLARDVTEGGYSADLQRGYYYFVIGMATPVYKTLTSGTVVVDHGKYVGIPITLMDIVGFRNPKVSINIRNDDDINIFFMEASEYQIYQEGGTPRVYTYYHRVPSGIYSLLNGTGMLYSGTYYLVLDNTYSWFTKKTIDYEVTANVIYPITVHVKIKTRENG